MIFLLVVEIDVKAVEWQNRGLHMYNIRILQVRRCPSSCVIRYRRTLASEQPWMLLSMASLVYHSPNDNIDARLNERCRHCVRSSLGVKIWMMLRWRLFLGSLMYPMLQTRIYIRTTTFKGSMICVIAPCYQAEQSHFSTRGRSSGVAHLNCS